MLKLATRFVKDEDGQGLAEYGLILALIAVAVIGVLGTFGGKIGEVFTNLTGKMNEIKGLEDSP